MAGPAGPRADVRRPAEFSIDREGRWFHRGGPVTREPLVKLLAGMLRRTETGYVLATPEGQRLRVDVADAPFVAVDWERVGEGQGAMLVFTTSLGERVPLDGENPLQLRADDSGEVRAYLSLRGLEVLVHRNAFYRLAEIAVAGPDAAEGRLGVSSAGRFFALEP